MKPTPEQEKHYEQLVQVLERTGAFMLESIAEAHEIGMEDREAQKMVFECARDRIAKTTCCSLLQASSLVRLALHFGVKKLNGTGHYTKQELEIILARLDSGNQETNGQSN